MDLHTTRTAQAIPVALDDTFSALTPALVQRSYAELLSPRYQRFPYIDRAIIERSVSRDGYPLRHVWDDEQRRRMRALAWQARTRWYPVTPDDRFLTFRTAQYAGNKIVEPVPEIRAGAQLSLCLLGWTDARIADCCRRVVSFCPAWMRVDTGTLLPLIEAMHALGLLPWETLRYIELTGDAPTDGERRHIERFFGVAPRFCLDVPGIGAVALECPHGYLHVLPEIARVEILPDHRTDGEGRLLLSTRLNEAMPLLCYDVGLRARVCAAPCGCSATPDGAHGIALALAPRKSAVIRRPDSRTMPVGEALGVMEYANEYMARAIQQFSIEQTALARFHVTLVLKPSKTGWGKAVEEAFRLHLRGSPLKSATWTFSVSKTPLTRPAFVPLAADEEKEAL